jgi:hypothetical protein
MKDLFKKFAILTVLGFASLSISSSVLAQEWPMVGGDYWEVSAIDVKDGAGLKYSTWLASEWRKNLEFAKSKGWIKDYKVLSNVYPRKGEASLYLIRIMEGIPTGAEGEQRAMEWVKWMEKSVAKMQEESGNRAEYREVMSSSLLQEMHFRD